MAPFSAASTSTGTTPNALSPSTCPTTSPRHSSSSDIQLWIPHNTNLTNLFRYNTGPKYRGWPSIHPTSCPRMPSNASKISLALLCTTVTQSIQHYSLLSAPLLQAKQTAPLLSLKHANSSSTTLQHIQMPASATRHGTWSLPSTPTHLTSQNKQEKVAHQATSISPTTAAKISTTTPYSPYRPSSNMSCHPRLKRNSLHFTMATNLSSLFAKLLKKWVILSTNASW